VRGLLAYARQSVVMKLYKWSVECKHYRSKAEKLNQSA
jgi:hypothetical protein